MNSKRKGNAKEWVQTKARRGTRIVENNKSRRGVEKSRERKNVEYLVVGYKVVVAFGMCRNEGILCEDTICVDDNSRHR